MNNKFEHPHAAQALVNWVAVPGGGMVMDTLVISASIPLDPSDADFNQSKVNSLEAAARAFVKTRGIKHVVFTQG